MTAVDVYWISVLATLCNFVLVVAGLGVVFVLYAVAYRILGASPEEYPLFGWGCIVFVAVLSVGLLTFFPDGKTVWATRVLPYLSEHAQVLQTLPDSVKMELMP